MMGPELRTEIENSDIKKIDKLTKKETIPEVLYVKAQLKSFPIDKVDGVDFININMRSDSELGRKLHTGYNHPFALFAGIGAVSNIKTFISFITRVEFPLYLLTKKKWEPEDVAKVSQERVYPKNYWALVAWAVCSRIRNDAYLIKLLKENELPFTAFTLIEEESLLEGKDDMGGKQVKMNYGLATYIAIIRNISDMIKADEFETSKIKSFIESCKQYPDEDIFAGLPERVRKLIENKKSNLKPVEEPTETTEPTKKGTKKKAE